MNDKENKKAEQFFDKLYDKSVVKSLSWFVNGIFIFMILLLCLMPAQELYIGSEKDSPMFIPGVLAMLSFMMVSMQTSRFKQYTENQKSRTMREILQYYPVSRKAIWKMKMLDLLCFLAKVTGVGLVLQLIAALIAYKIVSWMNFAYVFGCVFFFPVLGELLFDRIMKTYIEE